MRYEKPEIVELGTALGSVKSGQFPKSGMVLESTHNITDAAYEADE